MKRLLPLFLALMCLIFCAPLLEVEAEDEPFHAPYFSTWWLDSYNQIIDAIQIDWRCTVEAPGTYWACLSWETRNPGDYLPKMGGYAGFQTLENGNRVVLMSSWNQSSEIRPKIEYVRGGRYGTFDGEGTGKQIYTNYDWQPDTWYTMRVQFRDSKDKTYVEQWLKEKNGEWELLSMMSYPFPGVRMTNVGGFQEDFAFNNKRRSERIKNAYYRLSPSKQWIANKSFTFTNSYMNDNDNDDPNSPWVSSDLNDVTFNCNWGKKKDYLWIETGGGDFTPNGKYLPADFYLDQPAQPEETAFLNSKDQLEKMKMDGVVDLWIYWRAYQVYDIITEDFSLTQSSGDTLYRLFNFQEGQLSYWDTPSQKLLLLGFYNTNEHNAEIIWLNPKLESEISEQDWGQEVWINYPLAVETWYTYRIQAWEKNKKTLYGYWIKPKNGDWTLLGIMAYPERKHAITNPSFSTESYEGFGFREFRIKNAYGKILSKKQWEHWEHYQIVNEFDPYNYNYPDEFPGYNIENNLDTGRHKNGYVWCRFGGKEWKNFDRYYPFTFRIKGEDDKPEFDKFIEDGIPKKYRP